MSRGHNRRGRKPGPFDAGDGWGFTFSPEVLAYGDALADRGGMTEREIMRAAIYAEAFGLAATVGPSGGCSVFARPLCPAGWDCLNPAHQRLEDVPA